MTLMIALARTALPLKLHAFQVLQERGEPPSVVVTKKITIGPNRLLSSSTVQKTDPQVRPGVRRLPRICAKHIHRGCSLGSS
jgi:hypothetical protein